MKKAEATEEETEKMVTSSVDGKEQDKEKEVVAASDAVIKDDKYEKDKEKEKKPKDKKKKVSEYIHITLSRFVLLLLSASTLLHGLVPSHVLTYSSYQVQL